ncbi:MAG: acyl-CoA dehydratase activase-related protein [Propionibacteriaceae bacterium]|jgi:predicted CoA-substrate-specific enzyme activase|nr:acyl-CoA dehydratase activase-related protein [Propionibacteriaceae bacterium]
MEETEVEGTEVTLGLDVGSTTLKAVLLDGDKVLCEEYRRHNADVQAELTRLVHELARRFPGLAVRPAITGSGGLGIARALDVEFIQEVIAGSKAVQRYEPDADVVIELGGEDAKITYLKPIPEQRMNGTCAGGTGAFIDQMATLLRTDAAGLDALAREHLHLYPIASRCGVFAKSDLQPLINDGARHEDLAASIFQAVATQTISGLAQGRPIRGRVVLLGGPLFFLPELRAAFERALAGQASGFTCPERAQLFVALGAALAARGEPVKLAELADRLLDRRHLVPQSGRLPALFANPKERAEFDRRHGAEQIPRADLAAARGAVYLGLDAGSTTIKAVLIDDAEQILWSYYASNGGDPVKAAVVIATTVRRALPPAAVIARSCVTGYGEGLIKAALHIDEGEVETIAHFRAADKIAPGVSAVIDIGGQDMKYLRIHDSVIDSIAVNEACSSGCGSFLQTFAESLGLSIEEFTAAALDATAPVDLGSRCTVFMNSSVKQSQKEGASVGEIAAGLSYAVIRNALYKVIKLRDPGQLGDRVVVQGGSFLNDAVLRAFELLTGREVVRPDIAGLMGAYGAALTAKARMVPGKPGRLLSVPQLGQITVDTQMSNCQLCQNHCSCTISLFGNGEQYVSGNRCERGADPAKAKSTLPNMFDYTYKRIFGYRRLTAKEGVRGDIGVPRALNLYENYPFWFTILSSLKFRVVLSPRSSHALFERGMDSIASENVCYPAKLAHGHIESLLDKGVTTIFYPSVAYEQQLISGADKNYNCPVVASYPQVIQNNLEGIRGEKVRFLNPYVNLANPAKLAERLAEVFADWGVTLSEAEAAVEAGYAEDAKVRADIRAEAARARQLCREQGVRGIVLAGRPYHLDPEVNHGIPELVNSLGLAVFTEDSVIADSAAGEDSPLERPLRVRDQWAYHSRLYEAAAVVAADPGLELVQLNSFGCGLDAITSEQVAEILEAKNRVYTLLKIDEVSSLGAARIRLRSLAAATEERTRRQQALRPPVRSHALQRVAFTEEMKAKHTIIAPQMAPVQFRFIEPVLWRAGYKVKVLEQASAADVEAGLTTVNNDSCYPAIMVVGQLVQAFRSGAYDPDATSVMITQTGGMCRATNYVALLRRALRDAGYAQVPVIAISTSGIEKNPGLKITLKLAHQVMRALAFGDALQDLLLRVRPYEAVPGSATQLYRRWDAIGREFFEHGASALYARRLTYRRLVKGMVEEFDAFPLDGSPRRPRVGVVGEILVKFQPDANNHVIDVIESEGCEAALPGLMEFMVNGLYTTEWNWANLGVDGKWRRSKKLLRRYLETYRAPYKAALAKANARHAEQKFTIPGDMAEMARRAEEVTSLGNQAGEGWLLTAEILELICDGTPNVICVQPFACLPNHVTGKGMFKEIRRQHPEANLVTIDYDPGASEVNQLNRIKLMLATAHLAGAGAPGQAARTPAAEQVFNDRRTEAVSGART